MQSGHGGGFPFRFPAVRLETDLFAGQCAFDENHFALGAIFVRQMTDAAPIHVEGFDIDDILLHRKIDAAAVAAKRPKTLLSAIPSAEGS